MTTTYHVKTIVKQAMDNDTETTANHLAASIYAILNASNTTILNLAICAQTNRYVTAIVTYSVTS